MQSDEAMKLKARRRFLATCGKAAAVAPPTITLMLAAERNYAVAASGTKQGNNGIGNGGGDGVPGNSGFTDIGR